MFHFGFSYIGLIYLLMLFIPNIIWTKNQPEDYAQYVKNESKLLQILERIGEVLVCCCVLIFSDFNIRFNSIWCVWLLLSFILMLLYEVYWIRYFQSEKKMSDFYKSICKIPVAGATLPVCAFFLLGVYGSNIFLIISTIILGIGHIGIHWNHYKEISGGKKKRNLFLRIMKWTVSGILAILFGFMIVMIGCRNFNYIDCSINTDKGVEEEIYVPLGGQEQYLLIRGENVENPVIIYLHGGPASPDSSFSYAFTNYLVDEYTVVSWNQRGCGRTYFSNMDKDPDNTTASFEQAQKDLDELVDYVCDRFGQSQVIIMGHSYGTMLGSKYVLDHPDKVSNYVGIGQVVSLEDGYIYSYEDALAIATEKVDDTSPMIQAYDQYLANGNLEALVKLSQYSAMYHQNPPKQEDMTWNFITSPYLGVDDAKWQLKSMEGIDTVYNLNKQLYDYVLRTNVYDYGTNYQMPVYFISGSYDWTCPIELTEDYYNNITAPEKDMVLLEGCGHTPHADSPEEFCEILKALLK